MVVSLAGSQPGGAREILAPFGSTVTAYTVTTGDFGKVITNRGATAACTVALPSALAHAGEVITFRLVAVQNMRLDANAAAQFVSQVDAAASSVTLLATHVGAGCDAICDGTSWIVTTMGVDNLATTTPTVA